MKFKELTKRISEAKNAGVNEVGTPETTSKFAKDTPMQPEVSFKVDTAYDGVAAVEHNKKVVSEKLSSDAPQLKGETKTRMVPTDIEVVKEATDKTTERLKQLVRLGLMDKSKISILARAMKSLEKGQVTNPTERQTLFELLNELVGLITGDDAMFAKVRMNVQKEDTEK
jgi:hypothetical protein